MPILSAKDLGELTLRIFQSAGIPEPSARLVADSLIEADLTGHDSHGVIRIVEYLDGVRKGKINPHASPAIVRETETTLLVDGQWGFGVLVAGWTMDRVIRKAGERYLAAGSIVRCGHIGRAGVYPTIAAERGFIGLAFVNGGGKQPRVAPFGGRRPVFGTNPLAAALPVKGQPPIVLDFSTSVVASGKIRVIRDQGGEVPEGWILDRDGRPSRRPRDYYDGGMLLPAAGHKGYALSLLVEVLGGLLTGAGTPMLPDGRYEVGNGVLFIVLNVEAFRPFADFAEDVRALAQTIKATPPAPGVDEVALPGEPEWQTRTRRLEEGISIPDATWQAIVDAARSVGIES